MIRRGNHRRRFKSGWGQGPLFAFVALLAALIPYTASAQLFGERPPPVPPASVPEAPSGPAISLAPPSGPAAMPSLPAPLTQVPVKAHIPVI